MSKTSNLFMLLMLNVALTGRAHAEDRFFDSNGVQIHYVKQGTSGDAVVLLHGWMGDSTMWGPRGTDGNVKLDSEDAKEYQIIAIDLRGHGKSGKPHDPQQYGPEMAEDVVRLLDHLKIEKAHLVGYSMGAFIAGRVAATHPERVLSIVYGGQAPILTRPDRVDSSEVEIFAKAVELDDLSLYAREVTPAGRPKPTEAQAKMIAKFMFTGKDVKALAAAGRSFKSIDVTIDQLKQCKVPTLFIHGSKEAEDTQRAAVSLREQLPDIPIEIKIIEGGDHVTTLTKPEFATTIKEFLRKHKRN